MLWALASEVVLVSEGAVWRLLDWWKVGGEGVWLWRCGLGCCLCGGGSVSALSLVLCLSVTAIVVNSSLTTQEGGA